MTEVKVTEIKATDIVDTNLTENGVLTIIMNKPEILNSLNRPFIEALLAAFEEANQNQAVRVIILTGSGRGFCAGADLANGQWPVEDGWSPGKVTANAMEVGYNKLARAIMNCDKPVITAINGMTAGGGVGVALAGDLVIAAESAKFRLVFGPQLGIIPDVGSSWLVPRLIGLARANGIAMLGDNLDAVTAAEWGMIWQAVPDDALMEKAHEYAMRMADGAIAGIKAVSRAHDHAMMATFDQQLDYERDMQEHYCDQPEFAEGVKAFIEKRKPDFRKAEQKRK